MRQGRAWIVRAMLLLVRGYSAAKNLWLTVPIWSVKYDKDMEACQDMNDKSKPSLSPVTLQARRHLHTLRSSGPAYRGQRSGPGNGFITRLMALCSMPRTNPGDRLQYKRVNGPYTLIMYSSGQYKLPFGNFPGCCLPGFAPKRSGDPKPRVGSGSFPFPVHAETRNQQRQAAAFAASKPGFAIK